MMEAALRWLVKQGRTAGYALRIDSGDWQECTLEGFIAAEKEAGFGGPGHQAGQPATYAFVGFFTHGLGTQAVKIKVEGKVLLQ